MSPARPDIPPGTDFSLHFFGVPDKQVVAFWEMLDKCPRGRPLSVKLDVGTRVRALNGLDHGLVGTVGAINGDLRRVDFEHHWAKILTWQLEEVK